VAGDSNVDQVILIVDGDSGFRSFATRTLAVTGFATRAVRDGSEALAAAEEERLALVVLEVRLNDVSGYEICRRLREEHGAEVVTYTADVGQGAEVGEAKVKALDTGASEAVVEDLRDRFVTGVAKPAKDCVRRCGTGARDAGHNDALGGQKRSDGLGDAVHVVDLVPGNLTFELTRARKRAKPAVARRVQRRVRRHH